MTKCIPGMKCQFGVKPGKTEVCTPHDKRRAISTSLCTFFSLPNPCLRLISQFGLRLTASAKKKAERRKKKNRGKIPLSKWEDVGSPNFVKKKETRKRPQYCFCIVWTQVMGLSKTNTKCEKQAFFSLKRAFIPRGIIDILKVLPPLAAISEGQEWRLSEIVRASGIPKSR